MVVVGGCTAVYACSRVFFSPLSLPGVTLLVRNKAKQRANTDEVAAEYL